MRDDENTQLRQTSREGRPWPRKRPGSTLRPPRPWPCRPEGRRAGAKGPQGLSVPCCDPPVTGEAAGQAGPGPGRCPVLLSSEAAHGADLPAGRPAEGPWLLAARRLRVPGGLRHEGWSTTADGGPRWSRPSGLGPPSGRQGHCAGHPVTLCGCGGTRLCPRSRGHLHPGGWRSQSSEDGSRPRGAWKTCAPPCTDTAPRSRTTPPAKTKIHAERTGFSEPFSLRRTTTSRRPRVGGRPGPPRGRRAGPPGRNAGDGARSAETPAQDRAGRHQESWAHPGPRKGCAPNPGGAGGRGPRALRI